MYNKNIGTQFIIAIDKGVTLIRAYVIIIILCITIYDVVCSKCKILIFFIFQVMKEF